MASNSERCLRRADGVAERAIAGETVLVPIRRSPRERVSVLSLNEVGSCVWAALKSPIGEGALALRVADEFEVDPEVAARDLAPFLARLRELGLLIELSGEACP
ncbi:MAG: PqqD family protein [Deltaproteobacteria bacterium]